MTDKTCLNCKHYEEILSEVVDYCKKKEKAIYFLCEDCESFEKGGMND